jgi:hypothetical protein
MKNSILLLLSFILIMSCSKELTFEEKFEGTWTGLLTQKNCCTFDTQVTISALVIGQNSANGAYTNADYTICNNDFFNCEESKNDPSNCSFNWNFTLSNGSTVTFLETPSDLTRCAIGTVTLSLINEDMISVKWVDVDNETNLADGTLKRK